MNKFISEDTQKLLGTVNVLILLSCMTLAIGEFAFLIPIYSFSTSNLGEILQLFLFSLGFYLIYCLVLTSLTSIIILVSLLFADKLKAFYYFVLLIFLAVLNFVPFYIISNALLIEVTDNFSLKLSVGILLSILISAFISIVIVNSVDLFKEYNLKYWRFIAPVLLFVPLFLIYWGLQRFENFSILLVYYNFVLSLLFMMFYSSLYLSGKLELIKKVQYKFLLIPVLIIIVVTVFYFPSQGKLEALAKRKSLFQNSIICTLSTVLDFDRDGYGPAYIVGGSDPDNFDSDVTPFSFDEPENSIDENNFGGDAVKPKEEERKALASKKFDIVIFVLINNLSLAQINSENAPDLFGILLQSKTFKNLGSYSCDRLLTILNLFSSKVINVKPFDKSARSNIAKENIFKKIKSENYFLQSYLDIPYSASNDMFNLMSTSDIIVANNNSYKNYVSFSKLITDLDYHRDNKQFVFLLLDGSNLSYLNDLLKGLKQFLVEKNIYNKSLISFVFLPQDTDKNDCKAFNVPVSFYYFGIEPGVDSTKLSSSDFLPTMFDILKIKYAPNSFIGKSFVNQFENKSEEEKENVFIDPLYRAITVINKDYKLVYNIKEGYLEVYERDKDPDEENNIAYTNFKGKKDLLNKVDFYLNTYSK